VIIARARPRRRSCVELQVFSNACVHQASGRESAQQLEAIREPSGRVPEFRAGCRRSFQDDIRDDGGFFGMGH
jgi:hypothetical protein